jgi:peptidoglycan/LPS O-acetylase OafA/YrhL
MKLKRILPVLLVVLLLGCALCTTAYAAPTGDVAGAIENTWSDASGHVETICLMSKE